MKILMKLSALLLIMQLGTVVAMDDRKDTLERLPGEYVRLHKGVAESDATEGSAYCEILLQKIELAKQFKLKHCADKFIELLFELRKKEDSSLVALPADDRTRIDKVGDENNMTIDEVKQFDAEVLRLTTDATKEANQAIAVVKQAVEGCIASDKTMTQENQGLLAQRLKENLPKCGKSIDELWREIEKGYCELDALERLQHLKPLFDCKGNLPVDFKFYVKEEQKVVEKSSKGLTTLRSKLYKIGAAAVTLAGLGLVLWKFVYPRYKNGFKQRASKPAVASKAAAH